MNGKLARYQVVVTRFARILDTDERHSASSLRFRGIVRLEVILACQVCTLNRGAGDRREEFR